ncbi:MBL fold metallo-hydrolase [Ureibacillus sinduriensis]|uniref:Zn-dependent hydrolase n=1 Tax=Ureibacillus sinduriensis BLB-1 = JCM 15800 TaxID=1384057 RepID=A0A0A3IKN2_9BACL|nr:MBL fold metallo-hydrolase [Ureibacillus sinduriensis]KGR75402.1 Zn-dependent hydrolase [Ureibacillus sinduriensis BLB-1 = JCM 15800]
MHSINKIGERFWYITPISVTDRPILGMVVGNNKTLMIDAGNSEEHAKYFLRELSNRGISNPDMVVLTHWHWDHIFGLSALSNTVSIASKDTKIEMEKLIPYSWSDEALDERVKEGTEIEFCAIAIKEEFQENRDIKIVLPDIAFGKRLEIDLGGINCIVQHVGGDHASDSVIVYIKEEKILFLGDCFYPNIHSEKIHYTIEESLRLLDELEQFDAETYILSHQMPISKSEFNEQAAMLRMIAKYTNICGGDHQKITREYGKHVNRELTEDEMDMISDFANGY